MSSLKSSIQSASIAAVVLISTAAFLVPSPATAGCYTPQRTVVKYWGWEYDYGYHCEPAIIGPAMPAEVVGERITECDGTVTQWGITCNNPTITRQNCETICD